MAIRPQPSHKMGLGPNSQTLVTTHTTACQQHTTRTNVVTFRERLGFKWTLLSVSCDSCIANCQ